MRAGGGFPPFLVLFHRDAYNSLTLYKMVAFQAIYGLYRNSYFTNVYIFFGKFYNTYFIRKCLNECIVIRMKMKEFT